MCPKAASVTKRTRRIVGLAWFHHVNYHDITYLDLASQRRMRSIRLEDVRLDRVSGEWPLPLGLANREKSLPRLVQRRWHSYTYLVSSSLTRRGIALSRFRA